MDDRELTPPYARLLVRLVRPFPNWDFFFIKSLRRRAVEALQLKAGDRVLDAGCGSGGTFPYLVEKVGPLGEVIGVEISPESAINARRRIAANKWKNASVVQADAKIVVLTGRFDGLVMFAAPDVYASPEALANLLPYLNREARVVVFGAKLSARRKGAVLNVVFRALMKLSFLTTPALDHDPMCALRGSLAGIEIQEYLAGCMFLAWGRLDTEAPGIKQA